jgi:hypothetical protein
MVHALYNLRKMLNKTGFTRPFHKLQILSWIINTSILLLMLAIILPISLTFPEQLAFVALFIITEILKVIVAVRLTGSMPTDPVTIEHSKSKAKEESFDIEEFEFFCEYCDTVCNKDSNHCKQCRR